MSNSSNAVFEVDCNPSITVSRAVPHMVSLKEAARLTGLSELFLRRGFKAGELVGVRCGTSSGGKILLNFDKLIDYLNSHTEQPENEPDYIKGQIRPVKI